MFRELIGACVGLAMMGMAGTAHAITFNYTGAFTPFGGGTFNATGSLTIDESLFNGTTYQALSNSNITAFSFTADTPEFGTVSFSLADVVTTAITAFDSFNSPPDIENGGGILANNGTFSITMFGTSNVGFSDTSFQFSYSGDWVAEAPEP